MRSITERFLAKVSPEPNSGCWLWTGGLDATGYGRVAYRGASERAHRISRTLFCEPIPEGACVLHKCDVRCCVNPDHLFLGDRAANIADMVAKGRNVARDGLEHGNAKLTDAAVKKIRSREYRVADLCHEFGVTKRVVYNVLNEISYRGVL